VDKKMSAGHFSNGQKPENSLGSTLASGEARAGRGQGIGFFDQATYRSIQTLWTMYFEPSRETFLPSRALAVSLSKCDVSTGAQLSDVTSAPDF
jgi:hypothetical protein